MKLIYRLDPGTITRYDDNVSTEIKAFIMSMSVENTVSTALSLQAATVGQEKQMIMLRKTLDAQTETVNEIMKSMPNLATEGPLGTNVNTYA